MARTASISTKVVQINRLAARLKKLQGQRSRVDKAIAATEGMLSGIFSSNATSGKKRGSKLGRRKKTRKMSAARRKSIGDAMKKSWAKRMKKKSGGKPGRPKTKKVSRKRKGMSAANRKKLSQMMKARWAAKRKAG